ncbi:mitochondrial carrier [Ramicandelaber brevisporus]|nr:mitochondrial carrier [Ramicandelaber brevisporus]
MHFIAGGVGGCAGAIITCPLDVAKTRLQSSSFASKPQVPQFINTANPSTANAIASAARSAIKPFSDTFVFMRGMYQVDGMRGMFRGLGPNLVGIIPSRAIQFATYGNTKRILAQSNGGHETASIHLASAATAGVVTSAVTNPIWVVKTRMQLQGNSSNSHQEIKYRNSLHCAATIVRTQGILGLYSGLSASILGVAEGSIQWVLYEQLKKQVQKRRRERIDLERLAASPSSTVSKMSASSIEARIKRNQTLADWFEYFGAAATAKLTACLITYPHEVLRTRLREAPVATSPNQVATPKYTGLVQCARTIVAEEGWRRLYSGLAAHLTRVVPNAAIMFFCYELLMQAHSS